MICCGSLDRPETTDYVWDLAYIDSPVARFRDGNADGDCFDAYETLYYTTDANHNVTALVDSYDGSVVERYNYDAYGRGMVFDAAWRLQADGPDANTAAGDESLFDNQVLFCGYRYDPESAVVPDSTLHINAWSSAAEHAGVGEATLVIADDGAFTEPRSGGVTRLLIAFSEAIDPATFTAAAVEIVGKAYDGSVVDLSSIAIATSFRDDNTVGVIEFSAALPDLAKYTVRIHGVVSATGAPLAGDNDRVLTALKGDASGDGVVDSVDLARVRANEADPISLSVESQIRADLTLDGRCNSVDYDVVRPNVGHDSRGIAAPYFLWRSDNTGVGNYLSRFRIYVTTFGVWSTRDPLGYAAGDGNLYRYCENRPTVSTDPSGLESPSRWERLRVEYDLLGRELAQLSSLTVSWLGVPQLPSEIELTSASRQCRVFAVFARLRRGFVDSSRNTQASIPDRTTASPTQGVQC